MWLENVKCWCVPMTRPKYGIGVLYMGQQKLVVIGAISAESNNLCIFLCVLPVSMKKTKQKPAFIWYQKQPIYGEIEMQIVYLHVNYTLPQENMLSTCEWYKSWLIYGLFIKESSFDPLSNCAHCYKILQCCICVISALRMNWMVEYSHAVCSGFILCSCHRMVFKNFSSSCWD